MIITALTGGMGNQLFQYSTGFALARRRQTKFSLDLRHYEHLDPANPPRPYVLDRLNISAKSLRMLDRLRLQMNVVGGRAEAGRRILRKLPIQRLQTLVDLEDGQDTRMQTASSETYLVGCWQCEDYFRDHRDQLLEEFRFREEPNEANRLVLNQIHGGESVCVHVRRGDYTLPETRTKPCSIEYYVRALRTIADQVTGANYFIFSDDPSWAKQNLSLPAKTTFVTHNVGVADVEDLRLMAACNHFIIANSTFSWWGAWLSTSSGKRVIAPLKWFADSSDKMNEDVVPTSWTRL